MSELLSLDGLEELDALGNDSGKVGFVLGMSHHCC